MLRVVVIGLQGGVKGERNLNTLLTKRASVTAMSLRGRPVEQKAAICDRVRESVWPRLADGSITIVKDTDADGNEVKVEDVPTTAVVVTNLNA